MAYLFNNDPTAAMDGLTKASPSDKILVSIPCAHPTAGALPTCLMFSGLPNSTAVASATSTLSPTTNSAVAGTLTPTPSSGLLVRPAVMVVLAIVGGILGIILVAGLYYFYRRSKNKRLLSDIGSARESSTTGGSISTPSYISPEPCPSSTLGDHKLWANNGGFTRIGDEKWDDFHTEGPSKYDHFDDSGVPSKHDNISRIDENSRNTRNYHWTAKVKKVRFWRFGKNAHHPPLLPQPFDPHHDIHTEDKTHDYPHNTNTNPTTTAPAPAVPHPHPSILKRPPTPTPSLAAALLAYSTNTNNTLRNHPTTTPPPLPFPPFLSTVPKNSHVVNPNPNPKSQQYAKAKAKAQTGIYKPTFAERKKKADVEGVTQKQKKGVRFELKERERAGRSFGGTPEGSNTRLGFGFVNRNGDEGEGEGEGGD